MKSTKMIWIIAISLLTLSSCGPSNIRDVRKEVDVITERIVEELESIESAADLKGKQEKLEEYFLCYVDLLEESERLRNSKKWERTPQNLNWSRRLREELERISRIGGCDEQLKVCQRKALHRLDAYEKKERIKNLSKK